jgi:hypothetical protein
MNRDEWDAINDGPYNDDAFLNGEYGWAIGILDESG